MRKLFKSAFKSIIFSKIGIILLSSIVFLTAGTFTLFNSASNAFQQSYKSVTEDGNLHDFTVKELYSIKGAPNLDVKPTDKVLNEFTNISKQKEGKFSTGANQNIIVKNQHDQYYLMVPTSEMGNSIVAEQKENSNWKSVNAAFRIKLEDLKIDDTDGDGIGDTFSAKNPIQNSIYWMHENEPSWEWGWLGLDGDWIFKNPKLTNQDTTSNWLNPRTDGDVWTISWEPKWSKMNMNSSYSSPASAFSIIPNNNDFRGYIPDQKDFYQKLFNYASTQKIIRAGNYKEIQVVPNADQTSSYEFLKDWQQKDFRNAIDSKIEYPVLVEAKDLSASDWNDEAKIKQLPAVSNVLNNLEEPIKKEAINNLSINFTKQVDDLYGESGSKGHLLDLTSVKSIEVNSAAGARKIVSTDPYQKVDKVVKFDGYNMPKNITMNGKSYPVPMSSDNMEEILRDFNSDIPTPSSRTLSIIDKGFKMSASWENGMKSASILDPSSFLTYVSPSYAGINDLEYTNPNAIVSLYETAIKNHADNAMEWLKSQFRKRFANSLVWVEHTPYIAIGSGITPDFSYPIIGPDKPMPDVKNEAILFTNNNGYKRIEDAFRGSPKENYLAYKFTQNAKGKENKILANIEKIAAKDMSWGRSVNHIVSKTFDTSESVILAPNRISFLNTLQKSMLTLSVILTISLIIFITIVISLVIKKHINSHKKNYGILLANGYSKTQIALTSTVISLVSIIVPAGLGYIAGHFMQYLLLEQFANVWTLPIRGHEFNWWAFISIIVFPFLLVSLLTFAITMWEIRGNIPEILSGSSSKISSYFSSKILGPLKFIGIRTKASMSLFITNISKMLLVFVSTAMAIITIATSISTIHKFDDAKNSSAAATSYSYDVTFNAPTHEGKVLKATHLYELGFNNPTLNNQKDIPQNLAGKDVIKDRNSPTQNSNTWMAPQTGDSNWQENPYYLKNLIQTKTLLDLEAGAFSIGANPWDIAKKLMPENQMNIATSKNDKFIQFAASLQDNNQYLPGNPGEILKKDKKDNNKYVIDKENVFTFVPGSIFDMHVSDSLRNFFWNGVVAAYEEYQKTGSLENMPYFITYGSVILGNDDETYTNVTGFTNKPNFRNSSSKHDFSIKGIKKNSQNINLSNDAKKALENNKPKIIGGKLEIPIIVNRYFEAYYDVKKGDVINYSVDNSADRFKNGPSGLSNKDIRLKIVGFQDSYNDQKVYTWQEYAREAMGWGPNDNMFNGVFTKESNPVVFNSLSLYSMSGFYPGIDKISDDINNPITKNISDEITIHNKSPYPSIKDIDDYFTTYSRSPYVTFANVNMQGAEKFRFKTTSDLSSVLILFIESITIFLSVLFIIIISVMMIEDNKRFISTLKVMGYRSREITRIFFGSFIPSFILAVFVSAPIAFGVSELVRFAIMSFGSILIPISLTWWTIFISFGITLIGAMATYWLSTRSLKNTKMLHAFSQ